MYCPSCGLQQTQELRYCPRCGANLASVNQEPPAPSLVGPIWAVSLAATLVTVIGLGFIFSFAMTLVTKNIQLNGALLLLISFFLFVVLTISGLLVRQLTSLLSLYHKTGGQAGPKSQPNKKELAGREAPRLEAVGEPPISVTENTTRAFEPLPKGRQTKQNVQ